MLSPATDLTISVAPVDPALIDDVPVAVLSFDHEGVVTVNRRWVALTGLATALSKGTGWLQAVHSDDWMAARRFAQSAGTSDTTAEWRVLTVDGRDSVWVQATSGTVGNVEDGAFVVVLAEIDTHKANEAGLLHRALHDSLTGLLNQGAFMARVDDAVERAAAESGMCAVLYLDLDHFKDVNDQFGHQAGDHLLAAVSRRIRSSLRPTDTVARLGGDEIAVLCSALESEGEALRLAERIVHTIGQPFVIDERVLHSSVSIGVAFSGDASTAGELVEHADQAMYRAKTAGRARWATATQQGTVTSIESIDVRDILCGVAQAHGRLDDLLVQLEPRNEAWDRVVEACHALTRVTHLLEGDTRIG